MEKAALFYSGYVSSEYAASFLPVALVSALRATVTESENHICRMLFKNAVELNIMMNIVAEKMNVIPETLDALRAKCVKEVSKTNGSITFKDAVKFQNYLD